MNVLGYQTIYLDLINCIVGLLFILILIIMREHPLVIFLLYRKNRKNNRQRRTIVPFTDFIEITTMFFYKFKYFLLCFDVVCKLVVVRYKRQYCIEIERWLHETSQFIPLPLNSLCNIIYVSDFLHRKCFLLLDYC